MARFNKIETTAYNKLTELIAEFGYWSNEVFEFNGTLEYSVMKKINDNISR